jgi:hypothetical protein
MTEQLEIRPFSPTMTYAEWRAWAETFHYHQMPEEEAFLPLYIEWARLMTEHYDPTFRSLAMVAERRLLYTREPGDQWSLYDFNRAGMFVSTSLFHRWVQKRHHLLNPEPDEWNDPEQTLPPCGQTVRLRVRSFQTEQDTEERGRIIYYRNQLNWYYREGGDGRECCPAVYTFKVTGWLPLL